MPVESVWRLFWAKTILTEEEEKRGIKKSHAARTHPLWAHLLDVTCVAHTLWKVYMSHELRQMLATAAGLPKPEAGRFFSLLIGLHDIGKAVAFFQSQHHHSRDRIQTETNLPIKNEYSRDLREHHGFLTIPLLHRWIDHQSGLSESAASLMKSTTIYTGFHHGRFCTRDMWTTRHTQIHEESVLGGATWSVEQQALISAVVSAWGLPDLSNIPEIRSEYPPWLLGYLGWATTADWLGSWEKFIPREFDQEMELEEYIDNLSRPAAEAAVREAGFGAKAALHAPGFLKIFGHKIKAPRPIQSILESLELPPFGIPTLTIIEAPTGEGKTEGAHYLTARQQEPNGIGGGLFMGMPTQAMSNAQFDRICTDFLPYAHNTACAGDSFNVRLVHGNDFLHEGQQKMRVPGSGFADIFSFEGPDTNDLFDDIELQLAKAATAEWFMQRKVSLLAPYGVGTVDQIFLAALQAKHSYLRLLGLSGKTVIFDEVHAYDAYMDLLFEHVLRWLKAMGAHVILLSATLPSEKRNTYINAWDAEPPEQTIDVPYPAIWQVAEGRCRLFPEKEGPKIEAIWKQEATIKWVSEDVEEIAVAAIAAAWNGATVGVILNRVDRAQKVYEAIERHSLPSWIPTVLFHARFEYRVRITIESLVRDLFGPDYQRFAFRPRILIATQVAEQSLDLDFDVLLTDLAPIDLLLQRSGRLHRHFYEESQRPMEYRTPKLYIHCPATGKDKLPAIDEIASIYNKLIVWQTWRVLRGYEPKLFPRKDCWKLPEDYRALIETVYDRSKLEVAPDGLDDDAKRWNDAWKALEKEEFEVNDVAEEQRIPAPYSLDELIEVSTQIRVEEEETADKYMRAMTRLGDSIEAICLHLGDNDHLYFDSACTRHVNIKRLLKLKEYKREDWEPFLMNSLRLSSKHLPDVLRKQKDAPFAQPNGIVIAQWNKLGERCSYLRHRRLLLFVKGDWGHPDFGKTITYDSNYGLRIH